MQDFFHQQKFNYPKTCQWSQPSQGCCCTAISLHHHGRNGFPLAIRQRSFQLVVSKKVTDIPSGKHKSNWIISPSGYHKYIYIYVYISGPCRYKSLTWMFRPFWGPDSLAFHYLLGWPPAQNINLEIWLVVEPTHLKNISQNEGIFPK